jgi:hypothetical protein
VELVNKIEAEKEEEEKKEEGFGNILTIYRQRIQLLVDWSR